MNLGSGLDLFCVNSKELRNFVVEKLYLVNFWDFV